MDDFETVGAVEYRPALNRRTVDPLLGFRERPAAAILSLGQHTHEGYVMTLKDVAIRGVETAGPDASVEMLANTMDEKGVGSVVITEENRVVGIVTDRDLALTLAREADSATLTAADVMAVEPLTMPSDAGLLELTERMDVEGVRRVPVVDDNGVIVGIVTFDDLIRLLAVEFDHLASIVAAESP